MRSSLETVQSLLFTRDMLDPDNPTLFNAIHEQPALFITTRTVHALHGGRLEQYLDRHGLSRAAWVQVLPFSERTKELPMVVAICEAASALGLGRRARIVGFGGGVCTDLCGMAAAIYCRGISHLKIPTTLVGLVDAGIGVKNAVNLHGSKSRLGTFHPPEASILDPRFLSTLDARHLRCGLAEMVKVAITCDPALFELLETHGTDLLASGFTHPASAGELAIRLAVKGMLRQLAENLFEVSTYERAMDFGHTFSPHLETVSRNTLLHGEAVAIDMAMSTLIAQRKGVLAPPEAERILRLLRRLQLPVSSPFAELAGLGASLRTVVAHRNGRLNLVLPAGIGSHTFLREAESLDTACLAGVLEELGGPDA